MQVVPTFLLSHHQNHPNVTFVIHTQSPSFVGQIRHFNSLKKIEEFIEKVGHENYYFIDNSLVGIEVTHFMSEFSVFPERFKVLLKRSLNFYLHSKSE